MTRLRKQRFWRSLGYAAAGVWYALKTQRNMRIHLGIALLTQLAAWWLEISRSDWLLVVFAIGLVIALELLNTAIEAAVDLVTEEWRAKAKLAKDTAAGAVLVAALAAVVIGICVYGPPLYEKFVLLW